MKREHLYALFCYAFFVLCLEATGYTVLPTMNIIARFHDRFYMVTKAIEEGATNPLESSFSHALEIHDL